MTSCVNRKCVKCGKTRGDDMTVTFHRFPTPGIINIVKASAWAQFCWPDQDFSYDQLQAIHRSGKVLCGRHFKSTDFYDDKRQKLSKFAVPAANEQDTTTQENECIQNTYVLHDAEKHQPFSNLALSEKENTGPADVQPSTSGLIHCHHATLERRVLSVLTDNAQKTMDTTSSDISANPALTNNIENTKQKCRSGAILSTINVSKLSEMTAREVKLYNICRSKIREIYRLRKKVKNQKGIINVVTEDVNVKKLTELKISNPFITLLQSQLKNCPKKPKGRRYSLEQKLMALIIYKKSAACYRLLRRLFALPCQSSLNKILSKVPLQTGINRHIFTSLRDMAQKQAIEDNLCILSFDEMAIRKHLSYDSKSDVIQGYEDHGNHGRTKSIASKALVFMLAGLRKKWKQPIAFYLSHSINADRMTVIVKEVLIECLKAEMKVVATVCDLSTVNLKVLRTLGVTIQEPYFSFCGTEIVAVLDPPHLLKCTRNLFMKHDIECVTGVQSDGKSIKGTAKWSDIQQFYNFEKNTPGFVFAPALTDQHLSPNLKQQMRVKLAAQVFSHSVTSGLLTRIAYNELPSAALATANFLNNFDQLFDAVNADTPDLRRGKPYSNNITKSSPHLIFYSEMRQYISSIKYIGSKSRPPSQEGWLHSLNAVERLWKNLQKLQVKSLSTRRLNQDPLENFFGCVRYSCGSNNNPTIPQFVSGVKTAIITNLRHSGRKRNCEEDDLSLTNNLKSFLMAELPSVDTTQNNWASECILLEELESMVADAVEKVDLATPESQACGYVSGFIFKRLKYNDCVECRHTFLSESKEDIHVHTSFREYRSTDSLIYVKKEMIASIEIMAGLVNKILSTSAWKKTIKTIIMAELDTVDISYLDGCLEHRNVNKATIQASVFHICLKRFLIIKNREIENVEKERALERKLKILKNK